MCERDANNSSVSLVIDDFSFHVNHIELRFMGECEGKKRRRKEFFDLILSTGNFMLK